jgi:putative ABC transport system permease protein
MIIATRWRKLLRDFDAIQGRIAMAVAAIALGILAVSLIGTAYSVLTREISRNYLSTNPASAIIDFGAVNPKITAAVRKNISIEDAEAGSIVKGRVEIRPDEWVPLLLFVIPDFNTLRINRIAPEAGKWPPPSGTILLEREALKFLGRSLGDRIDIQTPSGRKISMPVSGTVHDPALAPAWQEQMVYGYVTAATYSGMGGDPTPELLKVVVKDAVHDQAKVDAVITSLAASLTKAGYPIHQIQVPPTGRHPHQSQMTAVLTLFLMFSILALILASVLVASIIDGLLAQQVRQIAVMKAIGARWRQIAGLYLTGVLAIASVATLIGLPLGILGGRGFANVIATLLNFNIQSYAISLTLVAGLAAGGVVIPLVFAFVPVNRAARQTVREAMSDFGTLSAPGGDWIDRMLAKIRGVDRTLLLAIRNAFRRRGRLVLTLVLLASAGGMFIASTSVKTAWDYFIASSAHDRNYDLELQLSDYAATGNLLGLIAGTPGVSKVEPWSVTPGARARPDGLTVVRTYPDGGHASLEFRAVPASTSLAHLVLLQGTSSSTADDDALVVNQSAWNLLGRPDLGDRVALAVDGRKTEFHLKAVIRQIVTLPSAYVSESAYQHATASQGKANAIRIVANDHNAAAVNELSKRIETKLAGASIHVVKSISESRMDSAVGGHVKILVVSLIGMSILMAIVGLLGLASAQGIGVAERTREFGIMRTIGGTNGVIIRNVVSEGLFIGLMSFVLAILVSMPLAIGIGRLVGTLSFGLPLPLMLSHSGLLIWLAILIVGSTAASLVPAFRATRLTIRETLAYI